jgi:tetratricopeptide (TPR) repeat protein
MSNEIQPRHTARRPATTGLALTLGCAAAIAGVGCSRGTALPDLPQLSIARFHHSVVGQVQAAYDDARAHPRDAGANGRLGMVLQAYELAEAAAVCYERAVALSWWPGRWDFYLGTAYAELGRNDEAVAAFDRVWRPESRFALPHRKGECLLKAGRAAEALTVYQKLAGSYPAEPWAHYGLGRARAAVNDLQGARAPLLEACRLFPPFKMAHFALADVYAKLGDREKAEEHLAHYRRGSAAEPPLTDPWMLELRAVDQGYLSHASRGKKLFGAGRHAEAAAAYEKALELEPGHVLSHVNLIGLYGTLGQFDRAQRHYEEALRLDPKRSDIYLNYAAILYNTQRDSEAEAAARQALALTPGNAEAHYILARLFNRRSQWEAARRECETALEADPAYAEAYALLGSVLVQLRQYPAVLEMSPRALRAGAGSEAGFLHALGRSHAALGQTAPALAALRQARERAAATHQTSLIVQLDGELADLERPRP